MASRTIQQIYDEMITEKETFSSLDTLVPNPETSQNFLTQLTTGSKVGIWRLMFWVAAAAIWTHEQLVVQNLIDVEAKAKALKPGVVQWYADESLKFQYGYSLQWNSTDLVWEYADSTSTAAVAAQIITLASARDINQIVTLKVAKTVATVTTKLSAAEKASFNTYLERIKIAGTQTLVISDDADFLKLAYTIEYDPQLITSTGVLITDGVTKPIQVAIDTFITTLYFDATLRVQDLTDAIQAATGVVSATADVVEATYGAIAYTDVLAVNTESYIPNAGYLATVDETGTETVPVYGDINIVASTAYATSGVAYTATTSFVRYLNIVYKCNTNISDPAGAFDATKWDTVSNLTYISI